MSISIIMPLFSELTKNMLEIIKTVIHTIAYQCLNLILTLIIVLFCSHVNVINDTNMAIKFLIDKSLIKDKIMSDTTQRFMSFSSTYKRLIIIVSKPNNTLTITLFPKNSSFLQEVKSNISPNNSLKLYELNSRGGWDTDYRPKLNMHTLIYDPITHKNLVDRIELFYTSHDKYKHLGINFKCAFFLYGLPGTGKSSFASAVASKYNMCIYILYPSRIQKITTEGLESYISKIPTNSIILFEDVTPDIFINDYKTETRQIKEGDKVKEISNTSYGINLDFMLNFLSGIAARDNVIVIFNTNHDISEFPDSLTRAGRFDVIVKFSHVTIDQTIQLYRKFFPDLNTSHIKRLKHKFKENCLTSAQVQDILIKHMYNLNDAINSIQF